MDKYDMITIRYKCPHEVFVPFKEVLYHYRAYEKCPICKEKIKVIK